MIVDSKMFTEIPKRCVIKLSSIVRHKHSWYPKSAHNALPDEVLNILLCNFRQGFSFHPFGEVINPYTKNFICLVPVGKGPKISNPHCAKGHGAIIGVRYSDGYLGTLLNC